MPTMELFLKFENIIISFAVYLQKVNWNKLIILNFFAKVYSHNIET